MRTVVVTGGVKNLGRAIAERLRSSGWRVITTSHEAGHGADIVVDLARPEGAVTLYCEVLKMLGGDPPLALVNNAALLSGDAAELRTLDFEAPKKLTMLMACREQGIGAVVNLLDSSVIGENFAAGESEYLRAKADLLAYTRESAAMFADTLRVNAVAPGPVSLPAGEHIKADPTPLGRPTPEDIAAAVDYLLSAGKVSGAVLPVDGGASVLRGSWG